MIVKLIVALTLVAKIFQAQAYNQIDTYAGVQSSSGSTSGDGGPVTSAKFNAPFASWVSTAGNVFQGEDSGKRIRKINTAGIINAYFGTGTSSVGGNGGAATSATGSPWTVWGDSVGNIYFADNSGSIVRKINSNNIVNSFAGSGSLTTESASATQASFSGVYSTLGDSLGNIYVVCQGQHKIKKVATSTLLVTTFAGTGSGASSDSTSSAGDGGKATAARIYQPRGAFMDSTNRLYVTSNGGGYIRRISLTTNIITLVAGFSGSQGYTGDMGPATQALLQAGTTNVATDTAGNVYYSSLTYNNLRYVDTNGIIGPYAGQAGTSTSGGYSGDGGAATAAKMNGVYGITCSTGLVYVSELSNNVVRSVTVASDPVSVAYAGYTTNQPTLVPTKTPTVNPTIKPTSAAPSTAAPTVDGSLAPTVTPSAAPTASPSVVPSVLPTVVPSVEPSVIPTVAPTVMPSVMPTVIPSVVPTQPPTPLTAAPTVIPTVTPSSAPTTTQPTVAPSVEPSCVPTVIPTVKPSVAPSVVPSQAPTVGPTVIPTVAPSVIPTVNPSVQPSLLPTVTPTVGPTVIPTIAPTVAPSVMPTVLPSVGPTLLPTLLPTVAPSEVPSLAPSVVPTLLPSVHPTEQPTVQPSIAPSDLPTIMPSVEPSIKPTRLPTIRPSREPSCRPSIFPTESPTVIPSDAPTAVPSILPSEQPTVVPTTRSPTGPPTRLPTVVPTQSRSPTAAPSVAPSEVPTAAPTTGYVDISFDTGIYLHNVTVTELDETEQSAVTAAVATTLSVADDQVTFLSQEYIGVEGDTVTRRRLDSAETYQILVNVNVVASTKDYSDETENMGGDYLYELLSTTLVEAVDSNAFTVTVRETSAELGAVGTMYVGRVNLTVTDYDVLHHEITSSSDKSHHHKQDLSTGEFAGIVIGIVLSFLLCGVCAWYFVAKHSSTQQEEAKFDQVNAVTNV